jgi:hypothetical protein
MKSKRQIFIIHGGMTFKKYSDYLKFLETRELSLEKKARWRNEYLDKKLGHDFELIRPNMPAPDNAKYLEWKLNFENHFKFLRNGVILMGGSLGGIFLAKYLSENKFPKKIAAVFLVCPPFDDSLSSEDLAGGFKLKSDLSLIEKNCKNVTLLFSQDDDVVPISHATKYAKKLPKAKIMIFPSKNGHFRISEFPEIIKLIKEVK